MRWAVLPVTLLGQARETILTQDWFQDVMRHVAHYWLDMSGGRENLQWRVFDWTLLHFTLAEKQAWSAAEVADHARDAVADKYHVDLSSAYDQYIVVLDDGVSRSGYTKPHPLIGAVDATAALFAHEMGHVYAASSHANLARPNEAVEYGDNFCIMGAEGSKYSFVEPALDRFDYQTGVHWASGSSGPAMCAPFLYAAGWLDLGNPAATANLTERLRRDDDVAVVELGVLRGAPPPGAAGPPRCAVIDGVAEEPEQRLFIEFRSRFLDEDHHRGPEGWDQELPDSSKSPGWIVAHLSSGSGQSTTSLLVGACPASQNATLTIRMTRLQLTVTAVDPSGERVTLRLARRFFGHRGFLGHFDGGNPALIQGHIGNKGNFEVVVPLASAGLAHYWRDNDDPAMIWHGPFPFAERLGPIDFRADAVSMIQSNYGNPGNLDVVARMGDRLFHLWRDSGPGFTWRGPFVFGESGVSGNPVLIQSRFGTKGNFEVIVPLAAGGLAHYWRDNDDPSQTWHGPFPFAESIPITQPPWVQTFMVDAVSAIQSNYGTPGNLEVVARAGDRLFRLWRDSGPSFTWNGPFVFGDVGYSGNPVLIQSRFGAKGNFEVVSPTIAGGLAHYWRNNDDPAQPWTRMTAFGQGVPALFPPFYVDAISLIQSNYGDPGNFEVMARAGDQLLHFWRDSGPQYTWYGPFVVK